MTRPASLLLFPIEDRVHLLLTVRSSQLPSHAGQVSLPGGAVEAGESIEDAALREAHEEIGRRSGADVRVLGRLTPLHIPVSGFVLHPIVGVADARPSYRLAAQRGRAARRALPRRPARSRVRAGTSRAPGTACARDVPYFALDGLVVWGATAMVLAEFIEIASRHAVS